jgi:hypothetical protein
MPATRGNFQCTAKDRVADTFDYLKFGAVRSRSKYKQLKKLN